METKQRSFLGITGLGWSVIAALAVTAGAISLPIGLAQGSHEAISLRAALETIENSDRGFVIRTDAGVGIFFPEQPQ